MPFTVSPGTYQGPQFLFSGITGAAGNLTDALQRYEEDKARAGMADMVMDYAKSVPGAVSPEALQRYQQANAKERAFIAMGAQSNIASMLVQQQRESQRRMETAHANYYTAAARAELAGDTGGPGGPAPKGKIWSDELGGWATPAQADAARRRTPGAFVAESYGLTPEQIFDSKQHEAGRLDPDPKNPTGKGMFVNDPAGDQIRIGGATGVVMPKAEHEVYKRQLQNFPGGYGGAKGGAPAAGGATAAAGTVRVRSPNGVVGTIPRNRLQEAVNAGYTPL